MPPFNVTVQSHDGKSFGAYLAKAKDASAPVIVMIQEIFGVSVAMRKQCDAWAERGYHTICPDMFWRQQPGIELTDQTQAEWDQAFAYMNGFNAELGMKDIAETIKLARTLSNNNGGGGKVATMGFCLGGMLAFMCASKSDTDASISYYGVQIPTMLGDVPNIHKPLLMHFAEQDKYLSGETLKTVQAAIAKNPTIESYLYNGVDHAFARMGGQHFNEAAARLAHERSLAFLKKHLG